MKLSLKALKSTDGTNVVITASVRPRKRRGLTLIEVLIATTLTLLMMLALAQGFKTLSETVSAGRSKLTLSDQLRGVSSLLHNELRIAARKGSGRSRRFRNIQIWADK